MEEMSPKERFDMIVQQIEEDHRNANPKPAEEVDEGEEELEEDFDLDDEEEEEEMKVVDKNVGEQKLEVTREQHEKTKADHDAAENIKMLKALAKAQSEHLHPNEQKQLNLLIAQKESGTSFSDPVLEHLIQERAKLAKQYQDSIMTVKALQQDLLRQVSEASNAIVKCKGAIENVDRQILSVAQEAEKRVV